MQKSSHLVAPKPSLMCQFPCLLHPPPTYLEWLPLFGLFVFHGHVYRPRSGSESSQLQKWTCGPGLTIRYSIPLVNDWLRNGTLPKSTNLCQCQPRFLLDWEKSKRAGVPKDQQLPQDGENLMKIKPSQKKAELNKGRNRDVPEGIIWIELCLNFNLPWTFQLDETNSLTQQIFIEGLLPKH